MLRTTPFQRPSRRRSRSRSSRLPRDRPAVEIYRRQSIFPNNYYLYIRDPDWGPTFIKTIAYAPFPVWIYLNGNEWAKRQAAQQGIGFNALDNGFASCENPEQLAAICYSLSASDVHAFFDRRQAPLPSPLTDEDRRRGYGHALAFRATGDLRHEDVRSARRGPGVV